MGDLRLNLSLLAGLLFCCGGWFFFEKFGEDFFRSSEVRSEWPDAERIAAVDHVSIDTTGARIGLLRQHNRWIMTAPFSAAVDQSVVKRFLDTVSSIRPQDCLPKSELLRRGIPLETLKLDKPDIKISLEGSGRRFEFLIGSKSGKGGRVYAMERRSGTVCVFPADFLEAMPLSVNDVRSRRLLDVELSSIREIEVRSPGAAFVRVCRDAKGWRFVEPIKETADGAKILEAISLLYANRIETFLWPSVSNVLDAVESDSIFQARLPKWGVTAEAGVWVRFYTDDSEKPVSLLFGNLCQEQKDSVYALLSDGGSVGVVPLALKDRFRNNIMQWRDCRLFTDNIGDVKSVKIEYPGENMIIQRSGNALWKIVSPSADFANQSEVLNFFNKLLSLKSLDKTNEVQLAQTQSPESGGGAVCRVELEVERGVRRFSVVDEGKAGVLTIRFDGGAGRYPVRVSELPEGLRSFKGLFSLFDKTMLSLPIGGIRRLTRSRSGGDAEIAQQLPDGKWKLGEVEVTDAVRPVAELISSLKAGAIFKPVVSLDDLESFGLRTPWLEIVVDIDAADAVRRTLQIGESNGKGMRYSLVSGTEALFLIEEAVAERLAASWIKANNAAPAQ